MTTEEVSVQKANPANAFDQMAAQATAKPAPVKGKPKTNAERFPTAAKAEAEKKAKSAKTTAVAKAPVEQVKFVGRSVKKGAPVHLIAIGDRPQSGKRLYAHTHAALALFGMLDASTPEAPRAAVLAFLGDTAVSYHTRERNFVDGKDGMIRLTPAGRNKFLNRVASGQVDTKMAMAFQSLFIDGKADPSLAVPARSFYPIHF